MRPTITLFLALLALLAIPCHLPAVETELKPLHFAPYPGENGKPAIGVYSPMLQDIAQTLGRRVEFVFTGTFPELFRRFAEGEIDLAYLGPLSYIALRDRYPFAEPLVMFRDATGQPQGSCAIVAFGALPLPLDGIHSNRFALPGTFATCGYVAVENLLQRHGSGIEHNRFRYFSNEEEVILAVVRGEFDGGCVKTATARQFFHLGIRIADETEPLPGMGLVANGKTLTQEDRAAIRRILTSLDPRGRDKDKLAAWGETLRYGAAAADDADYGAARRIQGKLVIPAQGHD